MLVSGDRWSTSFLDYIRSQDDGDGGFNVPFPIPAGTVPQSWSNVNQITLVFDRDVTLDQNSLSVHGLNVADYPVTAYSYDPTRHAGTWTLGQAPANDRLQLSVAGDATRNAFSSPLLVLAGDADRSGGVNALDLGTVKARLNRSTTDVGNGTTAYSPFADVNGDGKINALDLGIIKLHLNDRLPPTGLTSPEPVAAAAGTAPLAGASVTRDLFGSSPILA
jgi:hypothetical protein